MDSSRPRIRLIDNDGVDYTATWGDRRTKAVQYQIYAHLAAPKDRQEALRRRREALLSLESIRADQEARRARVIAEGRNVETDRSFQDIFSRSERARRHWIGLLQALEHWLSFEPAPSNSEEVEQVRVTLLELLELIQADLDGVSEEQLRERLRLLRSRLL